MHNTIGLVIKKNYPGTRIYFHFIYLFIFGVLLSLTLASCDDNKNDTLAVIEMQSEHPSIEYGYMNMAGDIVIEPTLKYELCGSKTINFDFHDERAMFVKDGNYGFINKTGQIAIEPIYEDVYNFNNGCSWVKHNGSWHKIDKNGRVVADTDFEGICFPEEDMMGIMKDGFWGYADKNGNVIIKPQYSDICKFVGGYAFVVISLTCEDDGAAYNRWGCIDINGNIITEPIYNAKYIDVDDYSDGMILIIDYKIVNGEYIEDYKYVNNKGEILFRLECSDATEFCEGLACIRLISHRYVFINKNGNQALENDFFYATNYKEGMACVQPNEGGGYGFIDKSGAFIIDPLYEYIAEFSGGLALVRKDGKYGYIDKAGNTIIPFQFDRAYDFINGMAIADGVFIDRYGNTIIAPPEGYSIINFDGETTACDGLIPIAKKNEPG